MAKHESRPKRWTKKVEEIREKRDEIENLIGELDEIRQEYEEWRYNLPENLEQSTLAEKLDMMVDIDTESDSCLSELDEHLNEWEDIDFPLGFGRD